MKHFRFGLIFILLCLLFSFAAAAESSTLVLPQDTHYIHESAFEGLQSCEEIKLPEGVWEIGSRAFANSSIKRINLPASIFRMGSDVFAGCEDLTVTVYENTYGWLWCKAKQVNFIALPKPTLTPTRTPAPTPESTPEPERTPKPVFTLPPWDDTTPKPEQTPETEITPFPEHTPAPEITSTPKPSFKPVDELYVYVNETWLANLGLVPPASVNEILYATEQACAQVGVRGYAVQDYRDLLAVFHMVDPTFEAYRVDLLVAAGELTNFVETTTPFSTNALFVITDQLPPENSDYEPFVPGEAPAPTPTPTPKPTPKPVDGLYVYVSDTWLANLGLVPPASVDEILYATEQACAYFGVRGYASQSYQDILAVFRLVDPTFEAYRVDLLVAAGELTNFVETTDPFSKNALFVITDQPAPENSGYEPFVPGEAPAPTPTPTPKPTAAPSGNLTPYINIELMAELGLAEPATLDELFAALDAAYANGHETLAAENLQHFLPVFQTVDPSFEVEKLNLMLASGSLKGWVETDDPFAPFALFAISDTAPEPNRAYVTFTGQ